MATGLLVVAYACLLPAWFLPHMEYSMTTQKFIWSEPEVLTIIKTGMWRLVYILINTGIPSFATMGSIIFTWGFVLPVIKLAVMVSFMTGCVKHSRYVQMVCTFSKWALMDGFIPILWVALLSGKAEPRLLMNTNQSAALLPGLTLLVLHCTLSQVAHLGILLSFSSRETDAYANDEGSPLATNDGSNANYAAAGKVDKDLEKLGPSTSPKVINYRGILAPSALLVLLCVVVSTPTMSYESQLTGTSQNLSILGMVFLLMTQDFWLGAATVAFFVVFFPAVEFMLAIASALGHTVPPKILFVVESYSMFDVMMGGMLLSVLSAPAFFSPTVCTMSLSEAGWISALLGIIWGICGLFGPKTKVT